MKNGISSAKSVTSSTKWHDYSPQGNVLMVTPQYLKHQKIDLSPKIEHKLNQLTTGEFVFLLPEKLRSKEKHYQSVFEEEISRRMSSQEKHQEMLATVSYLRTGRDRFVYNTTPISYQQFLRDPIIVVFTPQSTGEQSYGYWEKLLGDYIFFENLKDAKALIKQYGIDNWVGELKSGHEIHQTLLDNLKRESWIMLAGAVLGIATSILLFHTMNRLYFEEFRRVIFIKRISGLRFLEIHRHYLLAQFMVFLFGFFISIFFRVGIILAFLVLLLFIGLSILQLHIQMKKENKMSMIILKGA
ncbi:hypothetical protein STRIC_2347 [Streptococcus ictaluri 707-05]|uniref:Bacteriocin-associated integral membrane protein n=1 Tax=Streptococcus ictaluri 707-05 TaxID=764299 RepID=G5K1T9_9STRE|nr:hypothetical protein STRIC_2347 [Streptococcus ictaluri 707-05]